MMELLEYHLGNGVRAFSTLRGDVRADDAYSSFNITHYCGDSPEHVAACRRELCNELSIDDSHLLLPHQIHSDRIVVIDPSFHEVFPQFRQPILPDADAIVTTFPGLCIGVSTADCIPVLLYDVRHRITAAVHAGWRGAVQRIVSKTVHAMQRIGSEPQHIRAVIGPGIALGSFEVGEEVVEAFLDAGFHPCILSRNWPKPHIDLPAVCTIQLEETGVPTRNIRQSGIDTFAEHQRFFSARRLGIRSGRIFTGIIMK